MPKSQNRPRAAQFVPQHELPGLVRWTLPDDIRQDERITNRWFLTLPSDLWESVDQTLLSRFDREQLEFEKRVSQVCETRRACVGLWDGKPVDYELLEERSLSSGTLPEVPAGWGKNAAQMALILRKGVARLDHLKHVTRGYAGWLLTQQDFLEEHDRLLGQWTNFIARCGIPRVGPTIERATTVAVIPGKDEEQVAKFVEEFSMFFSRWRLQGLAGPYLPIPLQPLFAGCLPATIVRQLEDVGGIFFLPDTFPIPSRDELRGLLEDAIHGESPAAHLAPWMSIVRASNPARNKISQHARRLKLQHLWCVLHQRHAQALCGQVNRLEEVFARYLGATKTTIHGDRLAIRKQLGSTWPERGFTDLL